MLAARNLPQRLAVLEGYLTRKLANSTPLHPAVEHAVQELRRSSTRRIAEVRSEIGLSHTRFIQVFRENVGLTPKLFCRVQRFRTVIQEIEKGLAVNWADLAVDCGYSDQAHLIHDFRAFSGITPLMYAQLRDNP